MGWLKIDDVSKVYRARASRFVDRDDDDEDDENDTSQDDWDAEKRDAESMRNRGNVDGGIWALRSVNLQVDEGEAIAVVGHTGSGKTTLLRILAGLTPPTTGSVQGKGLVVPLCYLRAPIAADLTGRQNLALLESLLGMERGRVVDRMTEITAFAGMQRHIDQKVRGYSSSMYGRLALAAGLLCDPDIVLVDESLPGGDSQFRLKVAERLQALVKGGTTLLWASQKLGAFIEDLCPRCVWLLDGGIVADGNSADIRSRYVDFDATNGAGLAALEGGAEGDWTEIPAVGPSDDLKSDQRPLGERLLPEKRWLANVKLAEERWNSFVESRRRDVRDERKRSTEIHPSERGALAQVVGMRLRDDDGGPANAIFPGERVLVEIEVEVRQPGTEISVRLEFSKQGAVVFESRLGLPFRAECAGRYLLSFLLDGWLTAQEVNKVLYKVRAQAFYRWSQPDWEDTDFARTRLIVLGDVRRQFETTLIKEIMRAAASPITVSPGSSEGAFDEEIRESGPFLRVGLNWLICRVSNASHDDQNASDGVASSNCDSEFESAP